MKQTHAASKLFCVMAAALIVRVTTVSFPASAGACASRCQMKLDTLEILPEGPGLLLNSLRVDCPLLSDIIEEHGLRDLGEAFPDGNLDPRAREVAAVATFAALGDSSAIKRHARYALDAGATKADLREILYMTAVYAGIPRAVEAARALAEVLDDVELVGE